MSAQDEFDRVFQEILATRPDGMEQVLLYAVRIFAADPDARTLIVTKAGAGDAAHYMIDIS